MKVDISILESIIDSLNKRIKDLENSPFGKSSTFEPLFERLGNIEKTISNWEEEFYFLKDKLRSPDSKPHKCPVCDGKVLSEIKIQRTENGNDKLVIECHGCEGKGIVWG